MIKVLFLTINLGGGGAERVLVNLVNHMNYNEFDITVETMFSGGVNKGLLSDHVRYICRNAPNFKGITVLMRFIPKYVLYKYFIGKTDCDVICAYMHGSPVKIIAGCRDKKIKKISWLHNGNPAKGSFFKPWFFEKNAILDYGLMNRIIGVSNSVSRAFADYTGIDWSKIQTLYNTNDTNHILKLGAEAYSFDFGNKYPVICSVGGLSIVKGYDRLIESVVRLRKENYKCNLVIVGSGPEEKKYKKQIVDNSACDYIKLLGFQDNPYKIMKNSDIFISSSREEGLATVLTEALTLGLPVVSTDVSGAKEVLGENNEYGYVTANSTEGIYEGLKYLLLNWNIAMAYASKARERAIFFDTEHTVESVENMLKEVVGKNETISI